MHKLFPLLVLVLLGGCTSVRSLDNVTFAQAFSPFPPKPSAAPATPPALSTSTAPTPSNRPAAASINAPYVTTADLDLAVIVPPPPAVDSPEHRADLQAVIDAQGLRTKAVQTRVAADSEESLRHFIDALDPRLNIQQLPYTASLVGKVASDIGPLVDSAKECWKRLQPLTFDPKLRPLKDVEGEERAERQGKSASAPAGPSPSCPPAPAQKHGYSYSYPSGHATFGAVTAILLANMVPERRAALFARGWEYGENRVVAGVNFPSDVEAGRYGAAALVVAIMRNKQFQDDFAVARVELRNAMGLSPG